MTGASVDALCWQEWTLVQSLWKPCDSIMEVPQQTPSRTLCDPILVLGVHPKKWDPHVEDTPALHAQCTTTRNRQEGEMTWAQTPINGYRKQNQRPAVNWETKQTLTQMWSLYNGLSQTSYIHADYQGLREGKMGKGWSSVILDSYTR